MQLVKGESAYWINKNHLIEQKFEWQFKAENQNVDSLNVQTTFRYLQLNEFRSKTSARQVLPGRRPTTFQSFPKNPNIGNATLIPPIHKKLWIKTQHELMFNFYICKKHLNNDSPDNQTKK